MIGSDGKLRPIDTTRPLWAEGPLLSQEAEFVNMKSDPKLDPPPAKLDAAARWLCPPPDLRASWLLAPPWSCPADIPGS